MKIGAAMTGKMTWIGLGALALALAWGLGPGNWFAKAAATQVRGAKVERGSLRISVLQRGELAAKNSVSVKSEIEGQNTILWLIREGTFVKPGDLLVRLDSSDLVERELQQRIAVDNSDAAYEKAKAQFEIQRSQNLSDIETAKRKLEFANIDQEKYLKGDLEQLVKQAEDKILLAQQKRKQAEDTVNWSKVLHEKGFLTKTELDRDDLDFQSAAVQLEQADLGRRLLKEYDDPRARSLLTADLGEAERGLVRANLQAEARIADYKAALSTSEARLKLEREKLAKYQDQVVKSKVVSAVEGMVVYARMEGNRMGGSEAIQEGSQVREGQEILSIPRTGGMIVQASIHESVLKQVAPGLPCTITIDAMPGTEISGKVQFVALLPDKGNFWANPNQRLYRTEVSIDEGNPEMRPGMNCSIEILAEEIPDTLFVPLQCVFLNGGETIAFVDQGGRTEARKVKVGKSSDKWVQILDGLAQGEEVALAPPPGFALQPAEENGRGADGSRTRPGGADGAGGPMPPTAAAPAGAEAGADGRPTPEGGAPAAGGDRPRRAGRGDRQGGGQGLGRPPAGGPGIGRPPGGGQGTAPPAPPPTPAPSGESPRGRG